MSSDRYRDGPFPHRIGRSEVKDLFAEKEADAFLVRQSDLHGSTKHLVLLEDGSPDPVEEIVRTVSLVRIPDAGISFDPDTVESESPF